MLVKTYIYIPDCKISLASFVIYFHLLLIRSSIGIRSIFFASWSWLQKLNSIQSCSATPSNNKILNFLALQSTCLVRNGHNYKIKGCYLRATRGDRNPNLDQLVAITNARYVRSEHFGLPLGMHRTQSDILDLPSRRTYAKQNVGAKAFQKKKTVSTLDRSRMPSLA